MSKPDTYAVDGQSNNRNSGKSRSNRGNQEPLSGSKTVKNRNHSGHTPAEGHGHGG
ncbi:small acid-soluble spore protein P [Paenibacillus oryzisoli]|uniref:small acid-soluble spore protein P n=1 Tax=Paenibacillus oryzisoli TaxID=1850517 RepID=UPI003D2E488C